MLQTYTATTTGQLKIGRQTTQQRWLNVEQPTQAEIDQLVQEFNFPRDYLTAVLDDDSVPRSEQLDQTVNDQAALMVLQFPKLTTSDLGYLEYQVYPLALILTPHAVLTVSNYPASFIHDFIMDPVASKLSLDNHEDFILTIMWYIAHAYITALHQITAKTNQLERHLTRATRNEELFRIMAYQKSLIRFNTALTKNAPVFQAVAASSTHFTAPNHQALTDDIQLENQQAITMTATTNQILQQYSQLVGAVISNNLNDVMKVLTSLTLILTIPTIIGGIYGMNVHLPGAEIAHAFSWIIFGTIVLCIGCIEYLRNHDYF
ncbi:magnesium transporter [Lactobacillus sp.] [Lactiplantibacillus mudanjiangensis]|uniref:magnesium transporter CorA family protein n=1 Tax=Lactiplantibacillus mudanjiangensis TaxID=1296538 RepID=UPI001015857C|nr:magnesium transporter [Lactobacillus sp.] [Lactiplantibacillus mudanjiangensis]